MNPKPADQQRVPVATWIAVVILSVFWVGLGSLMVDHSREHDFVSFYVGSTLALEGNFSSLYDRDAQFARQKEAAPNKDHWFLMSGHRFTWLPWRRCRCFLCIRLFGFGSQAIRCFWSPAGCGRAADLDPMR